MRQVDREEGRAGLGETVLEDIRRGGDLHRSVWRDLQDAYRFYLDEESRARLAEMPRLRRSFAAFGWLLKSVILTLPPARRLILLASMLLLGHGWWEARMLELGAGYALLLVVLVFELRDKVLARDELEVGRAVQLALLPDDQPQVSGWDVWLYTRPANDVGGDLLDHLPVGDGRTGVILGDVAGKGLGAALLMAKLQATIRAFATDADSLVELGERTNRIFCRDGLPNRFATLVYVELAQSARELRLLDAGHIPPLVLRGGRVERLPAVALPLGIREAAEYREQRLELGPGDVLLIYSDGLSEAASPDGEMLGDDEVERRLATMASWSAREIGERFLADLEEFTDGERLRDDLSLAVIRRR